MKKIGPNAEPCGTPYKISDDLELDADDLTHRVWPVRYEVYQETIKTILYLVMSVRSQLPLV